MSVRERLYSRLAPCAQPGCGCDCLVWSGCLDESGYGVIKVDGQNRKVHRVAWELDNEPVPAGLQLDHVRARGCRHRHCAKVAHLEPVTQRENIMRGNGIAAIRAAQTECVNGHEFTLQNTYADERGNRHCRPCHRVVSREWARRNRASKAAAS